MEESAQRKKNYMAFALRLGICDCEQGNEGLQPGLFPTLHKVSACHDRRYMPIQESCRM